MANEIDTALKNAASSVANYVKEASMMMVETRYVEIGSNETINFEQSRPIARTIIKLDGDCESVVPLRKNEAGGLEVDSALFDLHQQNVATAIEYRARILNSLLSTLVSRSNTF
jgi:hypothetical protein